MECDKLLILFLCFNAVLLEAQFVTAQAYKVLSDFDFL